jgi:hypothetical protein
VKKLMAKLISYLKAEIVKWFIEKYEGSLSIKKRHLKMRRQRREGLAKLEMLTYNERRAAFLAFI